MNRYPTRATIASETEKRTTMKNVGFTAITATAFTAGLLGLATPALAGPPRAVVMRKTPSAACRTRDTG